MDRRTSQNQRKVRFQNTVRRQTKKTKPVEVVAKSEDPSCQTHGCGCGN